MKDQQTKKIPKGYKHTELGVIPDGWDIVSLHELCKPDGLIRGPFGGDLKKEYFKKRGYKVYTQANAIYSSVYVGDYYIDENKFYELQRFKVNPGDFIISCSGTIGRIYEVPADAAIGVINQALLKITIDTNKVDKKFFYIQFSDQNFQNRIVDNTQGGAMKNLVGMEIFKNTWMVAPPPLPEQQAIAKVLSDMDELIEALSKLIEKKKNIKKGAMQELLTGKRRLPGFGKGKGYKQTELGVIPDDWEVKRLGEIGDLYAGGTPSTSNPLYWNGPIIWLQSGRIQNNVIRKLDNEITITEEGLKNSAAKLIRKNSVLIAITGATCGNVAFLPFEATANQSVVSIITNYDDIPKFLYFKLLFERPKILKLQNGSAQGGVNLNSLKNIQISLPPSSEQQAIAKVLSDMDEEIEALEKKKEKYENLKKAMMQVLLTGKIRLKNFAKV